MVCTWENYAKLRQLILARWRRKRRRSLPRIFVVRSISLGFRRRRPEIRYKASDADLRATMLRCRHSLWRITLSNSSIFEGMPPPLRRSRKDGARRSRGRSPATVDTSNRRSRKTWSVFFGDRPGPGNSSSADAFPFRPLAEEGVVAMRASTSLAMWRRSFSGYKRSFADRHGRRIPHTR